MNTASFSLMNGLCGWFIPFLTVHLPVCPYSELERLSGLVGRPSESHPLHNSGLLSLDPVQDKTPLYSQLLQAYKWSNKVEFPIAIHRLSGDVCSRKAAICDNRSIAFYFLYMLSFFLNLIHLGAFKNMHQLLISNAVL